MRLLLVIRDHPALNLLFNGERQVAS